MNNKIQLTDLPTTTARHWGVQRLPAGWKGTHPPHQHDYDEFAVIWRGRVIMRDAGIDTTYQEGDVIRFPKQQLHCSVTALEDTEYFWCRGD